MFAVRRSVCVVLVAVSNSQGQLWRLLTCVQRLNTYELLNGASWTFPQRQTKGFDCRNRRIEILDCVLE